MRSSVGDASIPSAAVIAAKTPCIAAWPAAIAPAPAEAYRVPELPTPAARPMAWAIVVSSGANSMADAVAAPMDPAALAIRGAVDRRAMVSQPTAKAARTAFPG